MPSCDMHRIQRLGTEEIEKREKKESRDFRLEPKIKPVFVVPITRISEYLELR